MLNMPGLEKQLQEDFKEDRPKGFFATVSYTALWTCSKCKKSHKMDASTYTNNVEDRHVSIFIPMPNEWSYSEKTKAIWCSHCGGWNNVRR